MSGPREKKMDVPGNLWSEYTLFYLTNGEQTKAGVKSGPGEALGRRGRTAGPCSGILSIPQTLTQHPAGASAEN